MAQSGWAHELSQWIRLEQTPGVGPETARKLLSAFGLPENIFEAGFPALRKIVPERVAQALVMPPTAEVRQLIDKTLAWADEDDNRVLTLGDVDFPQTLLEIADPPLMPHYSGHRWVASCERQPL